MGKQRNQQLGTELTMIICVGTTNNRWNISTRVGHHKGICQALVLCSNFCPGIIQDSKRGLSHCSNTGTGTSDCK